MAEREGTNLEECLSVAYDDIKDRTGKMIEGIFVKDGDGSIVGIDYDI